MRCPGGGWRGVVTGKKAREGLKGGNQSERTLFAAGNYTQSIGRVWEKRKGAEARKTEMFPVKLRAELRHRRGVVEKKGRES